MLRFVLAAAVIAPFACAQNLPEFQWIKQVDNSGLDTFAGLGVDAVGNSYIAGSTSSPNFPVQSATQKTIASSGLYQIAATGAFAPLPLSSAAFVAIDPQNPSVIYVVSNNVLLRSANSGGTFTALAVPAQFVQNVAIDPANDQILYAGTYDAGLFKSTDGGSTWNNSDGSLQPSSPGEFPFAYVWIDPTEPNVLLANALDSLVQSSDGGASWQVILTGISVVTVNFDTAVPGLAYAVDNQSNGYVSTNHGQTFTKLTGTPANLGAILPDPTQSGRLIGVTQAGVYVSTNSGSTWTAATAVGSNLNYYVYAADWAHGLLYFASTQVLRVSTNLQSVTPVGPPSIAFISSIAAANGIAYVADTGSHDVYVTKLDPSGNIVYSTYFGGSNDDLATSMAVDSSGDVYVTGTTASLDFPVTKGAYAASGSNFLFKLNPDGSVAYSSYGPAGANPQTLSIDATGAAYIGGWTEGGLATTSGAYQTTCQYCGASSNGFFSVFTFSGFASKFDPTGATLVYSTYIGGEVELQTAIVTSIAAASDGSLYLGGSQGLFHLNAAGSAVLASVAPQSFGPQTLAIGPDGSLYVGGTANTFATTPGAFETTYAVRPSLPDQGNNLPAAVIARWDSQLANVLDATYFGPGKSFKAIAFDSSGNVYLGGGTPQQGLPTRTPIQLGFSSGTGFLSELSGDLSTLIFSGYFGDTQPFSVGGIGVARNGTVLLGGAAGVQNGSINLPIDPWVNSLSLAPPPALRVDTVINAASLLDGAVSNGEMIIVQGAGFGSAPELVVNGDDIPIIAKTPTTITAFFPPFASGAAEIEVYADDSASNQVLVQVNPTSPAIFSQNGSGIGQGYILNDDGTLNTPSNPAAPGEAISVFATGIGPITVDQGYAVSQYPVNVYVDGLFADGIEAFLRPVPQYPGVNVYEIQVFIPNPAALASANPNLQGFTYPPLVPLTMTVDGVTSQNGISISISQ